MSSATLPRQTAVVFMTNKVDPAVMDRLRDIHVQTTDIASCYVLLDANTPNIEQRWESYCRERHLESIQLVPFNISDIAREMSVKLFVPDRVVPGSAHLPLLWLSFKRRHKFYWFVEDDVVFTGEWRSLISEIDYDKSDLLCSHVSSYSDSPKWPWWATLKAPATAIQASNPAELVTKGFFPLYRISARALLKILDCQRAGWAGHCEVLIPTVLKYAGYPVADLNSVSPLPLYSAGVIRAGEGPGRLSTLRFRPVISDEEIRSCRQATILHPVKSSLVVQEDDTGE